MTGKQVAHYEVTGKLGEGGMGVVYEAIDRHLDRRIALKILPPDKVAKTGRLQRFIQEAKSASALNHPNIITIYDIGAADGVDYIAMELVPGRTLEDLLARRRMKVAETLRFAVQIAGALAAAHAAGIVHRDLKPANVMVTESGLVKVLDFGLAKLTDESEVSEDDATRTEHAMTEEGTVVGSAAYMSPEQAEGKKVDARSDIFSFGLVLYEMLSGKRAFRAETRMATMAAVLNQEPPPLAELAPGLPKELERIVARCLRKDLSRRSQSMAEIKIALEELKEESESGVAQVGQALPPALPPGRSRRRWIALAGAALALSAALFLLLPGWRETRVPLKEVPLTSYPGYQGQPTLSPDGSQFAFVWDGGQERAMNQLYVSLAGQGTPLKLTNTAGSGAAGPTWSPGGQSIAFVRYAPGKPGALFVIPALGGPERKIDEDVIQLRPAWSPDGKWLYFSSQVSPLHYALFAEPSTGGDRRKLTDPPAGAIGDIAPSVSPDGLQLVFARAVADYNYDLFVADLRDGNNAGPPRRLTSDQKTKRSPVFTADGKDIVYVAGEASSFQAMYRVPASGGAPVRMEGIGGYAVDLAIAPKGHRLVYSRTFRDLNLWRMPLPGVPSEPGSPAGSPEKFLSSTRFEDSPAYSPDGKRIAFSSNRGGVRQIWVADADGSNPVPLTNFAAGVAGSPRWSPDGQTIVFDARPEGPADIYSIKAGGGTPQRLTDHPAEDHVPCYSADGRWIFFASTRSGPRQLYRIPANGGEAVQITHKGAVVSLASPDGKWIYYSKPGIALWKVPVDGGEETPVLDGRSLYSYFAFCVTPSGIYFAGPTDPASRTAPLKLYRFADGQTVELGHFDKPLGMNLGVSPDGKWLAHAQLDTSVDDLILVENFR
jgi:Tol biopolymer transport system component/serine/threonine protein kinase